MEVHIENIGWLLMTLACSHAVFPRYFKWKTELAHLSLMNRQMMGIHTLFIAITVFLMGLLCVTSASDLVKTELGRRICFGLGLFWVLRLIIQFFGYSSKLWKGSTWKTTVHIVFTLLWIYLSTVFFVTFLQF